MSKKEKTREEMVETIYALLIGDELQNQYDKKSEALDRVAQEIDKLLEKIEDAELDIKKTTQPKDEPTIMDYYLIQKICALNIERWNLELKPLIEEADSLWREMEYMVLQMKNKVNKGLYEYKLSIGKATVTELSVVEG